MPRMKSDPPAVNPNSQGSAPRVSPTGTQEFFNARQAAGYLGLALSTVRRKSRDGSLPCHRITPRNIRYIRSELDVWVKSQSHEVE
ncbi:MAG: helix-turn-helix domain-containing protein [bacterium]|nr:helix-turn-helix domain-containing protein [bacterium]